MSAPYIDLFDLGRNNLCFALRLLTVTQEYRGQLCALEDKRIERDLDAIHRERDALGEARDISELAAASQSAARDHLQRTANIGHEAMGIGMRIQGLWGEAFSDGLKSWQTACTARLGRASAGPATLPEWLKGFGAVPVMQTGATQASPAAGTSASASVPDRHAA